MRNRDSSVKISISHVYPKETDSVELEKFETVRRFIDELYIKNYL